MNDYISDSRIRQLTFISILVLLGYILFNELKSFIPAFLGALTLYVIMRKRMFRMVYFRKWKPSLSASLLMLISFLVILLPIGLVINMLSSKINFAISHSSELITALESFVKNLEHKIGYKLIDDNYIRSLGEFIARNLPSLLGATFNSLTTIIFMYLILYFMLVEGRGMERTLYRVLPMSDNNLNRVASEVKNMVLSNAIGIPLIALFQGVIGVIGYLVLGVKEPLFWFVVTCITSMLPVVGAAVAYVSIALIFFAQNDTVKGLVMLAYGFGIVSTVDSIFRFAIQKKIGDTHPLVTAFGVIIGINLFGFIGLIFGPLLISLFLLLVKIYTLEFSPEKQS
ncbi:MAG: AI-2E family transporter [Chitinophagaceae bacterium]